MKEPRSCFFRNRITISGLREDDFYDVDWGETPYFESPFKLESAVFTSVRSLLLNSIHHYYLYW